MDQAHVTDDGTKGTSRRSGYRCIAPMLHGVHMLLHRDPARFREAYPDYNPEAAALQTQSRWLLEAGRLGLDPNTGKKL